MQCFDSGLLMFGMEYTKFTIPNTMDNTTVLSDSTQNKEIIALIHDERVKYNRLKKAIVTGMVTGIMGIGVTVVIIATLSLAPSSMLVGINGECSLGCTAALMMITSIVGLISGTIGFGIVLKNFDDRKLINENV